VCAQQARRRRLEASAGPSGAWPAQAARVQAGSSASKQAGAVAGAGRGRRGSGAACGCVRRGLAVAHGTAAGGPKRGSAGRGAGARPARSVVAREVAVERRKARRRRARAIPRRAAAGVSAARKQALVAQASACARASGGVLARRKEERLAGAGAARAQARVSPRKSDARARQVEGKPAMQGDGVRAVAYGSWWSVTWRRVRERAARSALECKRWAAGGQVTRAALERVCERGS
jgi:hypothetical protein